MSELVNDLIIGLLAFSLCHYDMFHICFIILHLRTAFAMSPSAMS